jgi:threonine dehydrogenase-like Zn-dependent dehydrogenase
MVEEKLRESASLPRTMKAAVVAGPQKLEVQEVERPSPGAGEMLVRLEGCGVCASNIPPWEGREWFSYPMEPGGLGHEGWGRVVELGSGVTGFRVGDRVAFLSGHAYAEFDIARPEAAVKLPQELDGKPFPGEPLGCAMNIFARSGIEAGQTVAIVGIGFLGALLTKLCADAGARVIAISRREFSLDHARTMGADLTIPMDDHWQIIEKVKNATNEVFCDVVIEAVGKQWPLDLSAELTKERGRLVIAGYHQDGLRQVNMQLWNWRGLDVINAHEREERVYVEGIARAVEAVASGKLDPYSLFTHEFPLEGLGEALEMTRERPDGFMKALVRMN